MCADMTGRKRLAKTNWEISKAIEEEEREMQKDEKLCIIVVFLASCETNCPAAEKVRKTREKIIVCSRVSPKNIEKDFMHPGN